MRSRHEILAKRWRFIGIWGWMASVLILLALNIAKGCGAHWAEVAVRSGWSVFLVAAIFALYFYARSKWKFHVLRYCRACKREMSGDKPEERCNAPELWGQFAVCDACRSNADFYASLPNCEPSLWNEELAKRWFRILLRALGCIVVLMIVSLIPNGEPLSDIALVLLLCVLPVSFLSSEKWNAYNTAFCVRCKRDIALCESRVWVNSAAVVCEQCDDVECRNNDDDDDGDEFAGA
ncbi:MAG: hypothetical protein Q7R85_02690 [bacterium]|nr:hypothetical protein [bacterium]